MEITYKDYLKAAETVERYRQQLNPSTTVQVSVSYAATVSATVQVPDDWSVEKIKEVLSSGYYDYPLDDEPDTTLHKITE